MEVSLLTWLALLFFYMLYVLLGACAFHNPDHDSKHADHDSEMHIREAEEKMKMKLIMVDLMAKVLLDAGDKTSNLTPVLDKIRSMNRSNCNLKEGNPTQKVFKELNEGIQFRTIET